MTPELRRARGIAAQSLLNDETLQAAWVELENELRADWETSLWPKKRDRIWGQLRHIRALRQKLATYAGHAPRD
jgi:hypothetical protein